MYKSLTELKKERNIINSNKAVAADVSLNIYILTISNILYKVKLKVSSLIEDIQKENTQFYIFKYRDMLGIRFVDRWRIINDCIVIIFTHEFFFETTVLESFCCCCCYVSYVVICRFISSFVLIYSFIPKQGIKEKKRKVLFVFKFVLYMMEPQ